MTLSNVLRSLVSPTAMASSLGMSASTVVFAILAITTAFTYARFQLTVARRRKLLPGRKPVFPMGSLGGWDDLLRVNREILEDSKGSDMPVAQWVFMSESLATVKAEHAQEVLRSSVSRSMTPKFMHALGMYHIERFMGPNSVGVAEGAKWKGLRTAIGKSLKPKYIRSLYSDMRECTKSIVQWLNEKAKEKSIKVDDGEESGNMNGVIVDVAQFLHALTLDIVCMTVFQEKLGAIAAIEKGKPDEVVAAFRYASDEMARRCSSTNPLDWMYWLSARPKQRKLNHANSIIRDRVEKVIERRLKRGFLDSDDDLLHHMLVEAKNKLKPKGEKNNNSVSKTDFKDPSVSNVIIDNVITMMWAGHDTTAAGLSFCLYRMSVHQDVQKRLREEIIQCKSDNGIPSQDPLPHELVMKLPFLNAVVMETLRLHPPALWTQRGMTQDVTLYNETRDKSVTIPYGSNVFLPIYAVHHSESNWENPEKFTPERFLDKDGNQDNSKYHPFAFVPFGGGNRVCPGQTLAQFEFKTILSTLVEHFHFSPVKSPEPKGDYHQPTIKSCGMFQDCVDNLLHITSI